MARAWAIRAAVLFLVLFLVGVIVASVVAYNDFTHLVNGWPAMDPDSHRPD
jgi:heme A synthase